MPTCEICGKKYRFTAAEEAMDPRPPYQCPAHRSKPATDPILSDLRAKVLLEAVKDVRLQHDGHCYTQTALGDLHVEFLSLHEDGQMVGTLPYLIRVTHAPTGMSVTINDRRGYHTGRDYALTMLSMMVEDFA